MSIDQAFYASHRRIGIVAGEEYQHATLYDFDMTTQIANTDGNDDPKPWIDLHTIPKDITDWDAVWNWHVKEIGSKMLHASMRISKLYSNLGLEDPEKSKNPNGPGSKTTTPAMPVTTGTVYPITAPDVNDRISDLQDGSTAVNAIALLNSIIGTRSFTEDPSDGLTWKSNSLRDGYYVSARSTITHNIDQLDQAIGARETFTGYTDANTFWNGKNDDSIWRSLETLNRSVGSRNITNLNYLLSVPTELTTFEKEGYTDAKVNTTDLINGVVNTIGRRNVGILFSTIGINANSYLAQTNTPLAITPSFIIGSNFAAMSLSSAVNTISDEIGNRVVIDNGDSYPLSNRSGQTLTQLFNSLNTSIGGRYFGDFTVNHAINSTTVAGSDITSYLRLLNTAIGDRNINIIIGSPVLVPADNGKSITFMINALNNGLGTRSFGGGSMLTNGDSLTKAVTDLGLYIDKLFTLNEPTITLRDGRNLSTTGYVKAHGGFTFGTDPGGGSGDSADIRYYSTGIDTTVLHIRTLNDADDSILIDSSGSLSVNTGGANRLTIDSTGASRFTGSVEVVGATQLASLTVTGTSTLAGVTATTLGVTGATNLNTVNASGLATLGSLNVSGSSVLNTLSTSGLASLNSLNVTGVSSLGVLNSGATTSSSLSVTGAANLGSLNVSGASTLSAVTTGALTASGITSTGNATLGSLNVSGTSTLGNVTTGALSSTSLNVSGNTILSNVSTGALSSTTLSVSGVSSLTTLGVSGTSTLNTLTAGTTTASGLTVTGATQLNTLSASGNTALTTLTTSGLTTFNAGFTLASGTATFSNGTAINKTGVTETINGGSVTYANGPGNTAPTVNGVSPIYNTPIIMGPGGGIKDENGVDVVTEDGFVELTKISHSDSVAGKTLVSSGVLVKDKDGVNVPGRYGVSLKNLSVSDLETTQMDTTKLLAPNGAGKLTFVDKYALPTASVSILGGVKIGTRLTIDGNGLLSANSQTDNNFTTALLTKLNGVEANANNYTLPVATALDVGGIMVGSRLTITNGILSANFQSSNDFTSTLLSKLNSIEANANNYSLPTSSSSVLGGVKVGDRLTITGGILSANVQTANDFTNAFMTKLTNIADNANYYLLPTASASTVGGVKIGTGLTIDGTGNLSADLHPTLYLSKTGNDTTTGTITATGFNVSSDRRLKTDIEDLNVGLEAIKSLRPVYYRYKTDRADKHRYGLIAQQVEEVLSRAVIQDEKTMLSIDYAQLTAVLINAVKDLSARLDKAGL